MLGILGDFAMSNGIFCLSRSIFPSMSKQHSLGRVGGKKEGLGREEVKSEEKKIVILNEFPFRFLIQIKSSTEVIC